MTAPVWLKASGSTVNGQCVEIAMTGDRVLVRDSKNPDGPRLEVGPAAWRAFLEDVRRRPWPRP